ncbi:MAG: ABC transporter substrate-binding protein [Thermodesulfovibrionia bacterium]
MRTIWIVVLIFSVLPLRVYAGEPTEEVKKTVDGVINILKDERLKSPQNMSKRRRLLKELIYKRFDFEEMSKRSLGIHWARRSPDERKEFVPLFSDLLERSYIKKIESYSDEKIIYVDESIDNGYAVVKTKVISKDNVETPIDYRLMRKDSEWLVYDVVIEGVSLVNNYRTQFNKIITSESYEALIKRMKAKQEEEKALE